MARITSRIEKASTAVTRRAEKALDSAEKAVGRTRKTATRTMEDAADTVRSYAKDVRRKAKDPEVQRKLRAAGKAAADRSVAALLARLEDGVEEYEARQLAQHVALAVQAAALRCHAPDFVFESFCATRLGDMQGQAFGCLPAATDFRALIERAMP